MSNKLSRTADSLSSLEDDASDIEEETLSVNSEDLFPSLSGRNVASTIGVALLVTGGLAASAAAIIAVPSAAVILMAGICMLNSPAVANKQLGINKSAGVRASVNSIREEVGVLKEEVDFLADSVDDLEAEADLLVGIERELRHIATMQGASIKEIVNLVNENEMILNKMRGSLRQMFVSSMAMVVMRSDKDGDMKIDDAEIPLLALRLQIQLEPFRMKLDTQKFESMIREDNDIVNVLRFCGDLLFEDERKAKGQDDGDSVDSGVTFDFETFCMSLNEEPADSWKMTYEEKASMVTVDEKICKGSVDVARGKRVTLMPSKSEKDMRRKTIVNEVKRRQTKLAAKRGSIQTKSPKYSQSSRRLSGGTFLSGMVVIRGSSAEF